jgi:spore coat protein CotH
MFPQAGARLNRTVGLAGCLVFAFLGIAASGGLAKGQTTTLLFADWSVQDVWLTVDPADWKTLQDNYLKDTYYPAQFLWRDERVEMVGIRSRGSGSRSPDKPNLLIAFNRYDSKARMAGLPQVILKANNQDASLMRELIAMRMFRRMGLPAPREAPARLYINGEFYGAYTLVEAELRRRHRLAVRLEHRRCGLPLRVPG